MKVLTFVAKTAIYWCRYRWDNWFNADYVDRQNQLKWFSIFCLPKGIIQRAQQIKGDQSITIFFLDLANIVETLMAWTSRQRKSNTSFKQKILKKRAEKLQTAAEKCFVSLFESLQTSGKKREQ